MATPDAASIATNTGPIRSRKVRWSDRGGDRALRYDVDREREHAHCRHGDHHPEHKGHYEDDRRSFWERAGDRMAAWFGEVIPGTADVGRPATSGPTSGSAKRPTSGQSTISG